MTEAKVRRVEAPEVRRAQIIDAAKRRFRETGFHITTMADIAKLAGLSVGLLYRYFPGKNDVIHAIIETDLQLQLEAIEQNLAAHPNDSAAALDAVLNGVAALATDRERTALMLEIAAEAARSPWVATLAAGIQGRIASLLTERFGAGLPPAEIDMRVRMMLNVFTALALNTHDEPEDQALALKLSMQMARLMLGLGPRE
jgi:AcrR family transcriptional regulator